METKGVTIGYCCRRKQTAWIDSTGFRGPIELSRCLTMDTNGREGINGGRIHTNDRVTIIHQDRITEGVMKGIRIKEETHGAISMMIDVDIPMILIDMDTSNMTSEDMNPIMHLHHPFHHSITHQVITTGTMSLIIDGMNSTAILFHITHVTHILIHLTHVTRIIDSPCLN